MLGEKIRMLRKENAISKEELAEQLGVSRQSISLWENGQTVPTIDNIVSIAAIFNVSTDALIKNDTKISSEDASSTKTDPPKRKIKPWELVLLVIGSPLWFPLLVAAIAVAVSLYIILWAALVSLWAVFVSLVACSFCGAAIGVGLLFEENAFIGIAMFGMGCVCAGLAILLFLACTATTNGCVRLTKRTAIGIKNRFKKEKAA